MDILGQSALIVAVTAFSLAVTALSRNMRNKLVQAYALLCAVASFWAFFFFLEKIFGSGTFYKLHLLCNLILAPVGLFFVRTLTRVETRFSRWLYRASILYAITVIGMEWTAIGETPVVKNLAFFGPSFLAIECLYLMFRDWRLKRGAIRRDKLRTAGPTVGLTRRNWIYAGALLLLSTAVMDHVPQFGDIVPSFGNILLCVYLFVVSEAIILQRLLNMSALLNQMMVLIFISTCFTVIYTVLVAWIDNSPALFILNTFLASFIILILINPIKKLTNIGVIKIFSRKHLKFEQKVEDSQRALTGVLDTVGLAQLTLTMLSSTLRCESVSFFILRSDGTKFRRIRGISDDQLENREILSNHPMIEFFIRMRKRGETPVILNHYLENEIDRATSVAQKQVYDLVLNGLRGLNANIAIPFMDGNAVLGFVAINSSTPPEPWGNNWGVLTLLYPYFAQAARTLKNMEIYVRLREKERLAALGEMAAGLAHEIRNPLGAIKGAAQYLEPQSGGPQSPFLQVIVEEVNRLNKVVTQFLDYSRPNPTINFVETDIGHLIERTFALFQSVLPQNVRMELIRPEGSFSQLPHVLCSPEQIKQVLVNLIQNSMQFLTQTPETSNGFIRVGVEARQDSALEIVLFVEDNGRGIPRENLEKIFIPFFTTSSGGTGLGLPICARIVETHGGRIDVVSEVGKITRFSVYLPTIKGSQSS